MPRKLSKPDVFVPGPESKTKRDRPWERDPSHVTRSYRDIPEEFHKEIVDLANELQVSTGELMYFLAAYGLQAYREDRLRFEMESKERKMRITGVNTDD